jgi:hypothetical protein
MSKSVLKRRRVYVASSWRNEDQPTLCEIIRNAGHDVYDFRNPSEGEHGFAWREVSEHYQVWSAAQFARSITTNAVAQRGFLSDKTALDWCDTCVLLLPCGRSAHLEAGYAAGQGKDVFVLLDDRGFEPELMYLLCSAICVSPFDLVALLQRPVCEKPCQFFELS